MGSLKIFAKKKGRGKAKFFLGGGGCLQMGEGNGVAILYWGFSGDSS